MVGKGRGEEKEEGGRWERRTRRGRVEGEEVEEHEGVRGGGGPPKVMWAKGERTLRSEMPGGGNVIGSSGQRGDA